MGAKRRFAAVGLAVVLLAAAATAAAVLLRSHHAPAAFALSSPAASAGDATLAGVWRVAPGSQAGYRAREKFINQPSTTEAVARTDKVTGTLKIASAQDAYTVTSIDIKVDLRTLVSQDKYANFQTYQRDFFVRNIYLESDTYPIAEFKAAAVTVSRAQTSGPVSLSVHGTLTAHGVTRPVTADMQVQLNGNDLEVVGTIGIDMRDYNVDPPDISFTKAEPTLLVEYHLLLARG